MTIPADQLEDLIACPHCDALWHAAEPEPGTRAVCARCHAVLIQPRRHAGMAIVSLALAVVILVFAALWFPFLRISRMGFSNDATLLDTARAFTGGPLFALSLAVLALIVLVPLTRMLLLLYVIGPLVFDRMPLPQARRAFRLSEALKPWSMAEIFAIGCAVALVKLADLAQISFGPAFWMFCVLVVLVVVQDQYMCRWSVWHAIDRADRDRA